MKFPIVEAHKGTKVEGASGQTQRGFPKGRWAAPCSSFSGPLGERARVQSPESMPGSQLTLSVFNILSRERVLYSALGIFHIHLKD